MTDLNRYTDKARAGHPRRAVAGRGGQPQPGRARAPAGRAAGPGGRRGAPVDRDPGRFAGPARPRGAAAPGQPAQGLWRQRAVGPLARPEPDADPGRERGHRRLHDEYVSTEHLLLALTGAQAGEAARLLAQHGIDRDAIYRALSAGARHAARHQPEPRGHLPVPGQSTGAT